MIKEALKYIKKEHQENNESKNGKKPVLIIEDLDRLDPYHLFRILNIISAHIDQTGHGDDNKFGFNNIILVMDYDTTKHIFHHFYGADANYDGYMSKFFCKKPFYYSIKEIAYEEIINKIYKEIGFEFEDILPDFQNFNDRLEELSMRDLCRIGEFDYEPMKKDVAYTEGNYKLSLDLPFFKLLTYMVAVGMSNENILNDLGTTCENINNNYMKLMAPLYIIVYNKFYYTYKGISGVVTYFNVDFVFGGAVITNIKIKNVAVSNIKDRSEIKEIPNDIIKEIIDKLRDCLTLSSLPIENKQ